MTRLKGHELAEGGAAFTPWNDTSGRPPHRRVTPMGGVGGEGLALCRCGAESPVLESAAARRRWHRDHKVAVMHSLTPERAREAGMQL